jgi:hypothetical protein
VYVCCVRIAPVRSRGWSLVMIMVKYGRLGEIFEISLLPLGDKT